MYRKRLTRAWAIMLVAVLVLVNPYFDPGISALTSVARHEKVGNDVFLGGEYMEIGVSGSGSFGTASSAPSGFHPIGGRSNIGLSIDKDGFDKGDSQTTGDFFLPGGPYEATIVGYYTGGGIESGTKNVKMNAERSGTVQIPSTTTDISVGELLSAKTVGTDNAGKLKLTQVVSFEVYDKYYEMDIEVENVSSEVLYDVRYMRSFDPDQDKDLNGTYATVNQVHENFPLNSKALVSAKGPVTGEAFFFLSTDDRARGSIGSTSDPYSAIAYNEDGSALIQGPSTSDTWIALTYDLGDLQIGEKATLKLYSSLNTDVGSGLEEIWGPGDWIAPTGNISISPTGYTNGDVALTLTTSDEGGSGVKTVQKPDDSWLMLISSGDTTTVEGSVYENVYGTVYNMVYSLDTVEFDVGINGSYEFFIFDEAGNKGSASVNVTNIDKTKPTSPSIARSPDTATSTSSYEITISPGTDSGSGVYQTVYKVSGAVNVDWTVYTGGFSIDTLGTSTIQAKTRDNAGNESDIASKEISMISSSGGSSGGSGSSSGGSSSDSGVDVNVDVNDSDEPQFEAELKEEGGTSTLEIELNTESIIEKLESSTDEENEIVIEIGTESDQVVASVNGEIFESGKDFVIEVKSPQGSYKLSSESFDFEEQLGDGVELKDVTLYVEINKLELDAKKDLEDKLKINKVQIIGTPLSFELKIKYRDNEIEIKKFKVYVEREMPIPENIDLNRITTAISVDDDGNVIHIPTKVVSRNGKYFAVINSISNSVYSLVWNEKRFEDVESHWSKELVNSMASRLILNGVNDKEFRPDTDITRAEFAAVVTRSLGLKNEKTSQKFADVDKSKWYYDSVNTLKGYKVINGYGDNTFRPDNRISREEAMVMLRRAMEIASVDTKISKAQAASYNSRFNDASNIGSWAEESSAFLIKTGIVKGYAGRIMPKDNITRAEVSAMVDRMLKKSDLAD